MMALAIRDQDDVLLEEPPVVVPQKKRRPDFIQPVRMTVVDIDEIGGWLIERLREKHKRFTDQQLKSWLRGCTIDNECLFLRSGGGVALATLHRSFLYRPRVEEVFVLAMTDDDSDRACCLYRNIKEWAESHGAEVMVVRRHTDVEKRFIVEEIGSVRQVSEEQHRLREPE